MTTSILNTDLLPGNACFGCGHANPDGLHIGITRDPSNENALRASFTPTVNRAGFPGITHGGVLFSAFDCLSTWVCMLLGPNPRAAWLLRSAEATYLKPAMIGEPLELSGWIEEKAGEWDPMVVRTAARRLDGAVCTEARFKAVPVSVDRLLEMIGASELPENWAAFLAR
jgi:acyl-coenzyme A thioesterase PaaI-like protein